MAKYIKKKFKGILNKLKYIDGWFWCRYTINAYSGCEHACIYCDARSNRYYLHKDFDETIYVKENAAQILEKRIKNAKTLLPDVVALGGVNDSYQPAELEYENTRKILEVLNKYKLPVNISTKSVLVKRDLDILEQIAKDTWCSIAFTITTTDQDMADFLEPAASTIKERFDAIRYIYNKHPKIHVGVNFMPIVPFLEDDEENIENVIRIGKESGSDYILFAPGMTLRDNQKDFFINKLKSRYPKIVDKFLALYDGKLSPNRDYTQEINKMAMEYCKKYGISMRLKRWIPKDFRKLNYIAAEKLLNEAYYNQIQGKKYYKLQMAGLNIQNLTESILNIYKLGKLNELDFLDGNIIKKIEHLFVDKKTNTLDDFL